ncbi:MAG: hypothetical protein JWQ81_1977 [Amycolatopsis sp.]|jgi:hypothetical protein|nr:hypothetical protein [Amycolatopsis sp.]MCU1681238.1 hypothetical protein [Amycolatopsis sp.]
MGFVIQVVAGKAERCPRTGAGLGHRDNAASGRLGADTATMDLRDTA